MNSGSGRAALIDDQTACSAGDHARASPERTESTAEGPRSPAPHSAPSAAWGEVARLPQTPPTRHRALSHRARSTDRRRGAAEELGPPAALEVVDELAVRVVRDAVARSPWTVPPNALGAGRAGGAGLIAAIVARCSRVQVRRPVGWLKPVGGRRCVE